MSVELLDIINEAGEVIGRASRDDVYRERLPHRIVHVMLERGGRLFLQRRSARVSYLPGHLCTSAGGHVRSGERPEAAALRELKEELGLEGPVELVDEFVFDDGHHRRIFLFKASSLLPLRYGEEEVEGGVLFRREELTGLRGERCHPQLWPCLERYLLKVPVDPGTPPA